MRRFFLFIIVAAGVSAAELARVESGGLDFVAPSESWAVKAEPAMMSQGGFVFTKDGQTAEADIFFFGAGQGGDLAANVARWKGRFEGEPIFEQKTVTSWAGGEIVIVMLKGTYLEGPAFGGKVSKADYMMLGAIVPGECGNIFIRMAGPEAVVRAAWAEFEKLAADAKSVVLSFVRNREA